MNNEPAQSASAMDQSDHSAPVKAWDVLRQTRESHGVHLVTLASALKVPVKYLDALEAGDIAALPDPVFARALAASVCRQMGVEPETVLRHWPRVDNPTLKHVQSYTGMTPTAFDPYGGGNSVWRRLAWALLVLVIALGLWWLSRSQLPVTLPESGAANTTEGTVLLPVDAETTGGEPGASAEPPGEQQVSQVLSMPVADEVQAPSSVAVAPEVPPAAPTVTEPAASAAVVQVEPAAPSLQLVASARTWVEVRQQNGLVLISRILVPGETFEAQEGAPWSVILGNAQGVQVIRSGGLVDVTAQTRGNVARLTVE